MTKLNSLKDLSTTDIRTYRIVCKDPAKLTHPGKRLRYVTLGVVLKKQARTQARQKVAVNRFELLSAVDDVLKGILQIASNLCECGHRAAAHIVNDHPCCGHRDHCNHVHL